MLCEWWATSAARTAEHIVLLVFVSFAPLVVLIPAAIMLIALRQGSDFEAAINSCARAAIQLTGLAALLLSIAALLYLGHAVVKIGEFIVGALGSSQTLSLLYLALAYLLTTASAVLVLDARLREGFALAVVSLIPYSSWLQTYCQGSTSLQISIVQLSVLAGFTALLLWLSDYRLALAKAALLGGVASLAGFLTSTLYPPSPILAATLTLLAFTPLIRARLAALEARPRLHVGRAARVRRPLGEETPSSLERVANLQPHRGSAVVQSYTHAPRDGVKVAAPTCLGWRETFTMRPKPRTLRQLLEMLGLCGRARYVRIVKSDGGIVFPEPCSSYELERAVMIEIVC